MNAPRPAVDQIAAEVGQIQARLANSLVGQPDLVEQLLIALLAGEHCYIEGVPGSGRSLATDQLAAAMGLSFGRIHCNSDLRPSDLFDADSVGDDPSLRPLTANVIFVDDLPRLTPSVHALVQQALKEGQVKVGGKLFRMAEPYLIAATTYRVDELANSDYEPRDDRFMLKMSARYPKYENEYGIAEQNSGPPASDIEPVWDVARILELRQAVRQIEVPSWVVHYALRLVRATRVHEGETPDFVFEWVLFGAGPRGTHFLTLGARVMAALHGRDVATIADVRTLAFPVLRHRIVTNENARNNGMTVDRVIQLLLGEVSEREAGDEQPPRERD
jgi:MoxR-like ATPase